MNTLPKCIPTSDQIQTMLHKEIQDLASPNKQWGIGVVEDQNQVAQTLVNQQQIIAEKINQANQTQVYQEQFINIPQSPNAPNGPNSQTTQGSPLVLKTPKIVSARQKALDYMNEGGNLLYTIPNHNILSWYFYAHALETGQCPKSFHLWSCMSMLAALIQDKYYYQKFKGAAIHPNLYVILVGPSGLGKDTAINVSLDYLRPYRDLTRTFAGRLTHASFTDFLCKSRTPLPSSVRHTGMAGENPVDINFPHTESAVAWVVTPELAQSVSAGSKAAELIKLMTSVYTATGREFEEITRQWGYHLATNPCVNWLAGTTHEWLIKSVGRADVKGGFASRVIWVLEDYNLDKLCGFPQYPGNFDEVKKYVEWRLYQLALDPGGEVTLSIEARFEIDTWFANWKVMAKEEAAAGNRDYLPLYMRGHDLAIKLATILRVASMGQEPDYAINNPNRLKITYDEMYTACKWVEHLLLIHYPRLIKATKELQAEAVMHQRVLDAMLDLTSQGTVAIARADMYQKLFTMGLKNKEVKEMETFLIQCNAIKLEPIDGEIKLVWIGEARNWMEEE